VREGDLRAQEAQKVVACAHQNTQGFFNVCTSPPPDTHSPVTANMFTQLRLKVVCERGGCSFFRSCLKLLTTKETKAAAVPPMPISFQ
jgi:hypothetical protein